MNRESQPDGQPADVATEREAHASRWLDSGEQRERWLAIQSRFVDEPRESVEKADALVADVLEDVTNRFAEQRSQLEGQWNSGTEVSTEDLRRAMQEYRTFFERLLAS
jgi:hypothetical protein